MRAHLQAHLQLVVQAGRSMKLHRGLAHKGLAAQAWHAGLVGNSQGAPVVGDGDVKVGQVVGVEHHFLLVNFRPAHPQRVDETEIFAAGCRSWLGSASARGAGCLLLQLSFQIVHRNTMAFINYITQIQFDFGALSLLRQECERVGISRPLVVTDAGVKAAGLLQRALDVLAGLAGSGV